MMPGDAVAMRSGLVSLLMMPLLLALLPADIGAQPAACPSPLATLSVPSSSYAEVTGDPFEGRVFVYVPPIVARGPGFQPFQLWIVEGVYGKPFVQSSGRLDSAGFDRLRGSQNVRATPVPVARGDGSDAGSFRLGRNIYRVQAVRVAPAGGGSVQARICR
jgi:hypothetical protein